jgi:hypothetical protein
MATKGVRGMSFNKVPKGEKYVKIEKPSEYDIFSVFDGYKSPIEIKSLDFTKEISEFIDNKIHAEVVQRYGVFVEKEELAKALNYDRGQYDFGYYNGYKKAVEENTSCYGCKYVNTPQGQYPCSHCCRNYENLYEKGEPIEIDGIL